MDEHLLTHAERLRLSITGVDSSFSAISLVEDQRLYVEYNRRRWELPPDWAFEPCTGFFDTDEMSVDDPAAAMFAQNILLRTRQRLAEVRPQISSQRKTVEGLMDALEKQDSKGDADEAMGVSRIFASLRGV